MKQNLFGKAFGILAIFLLVGSVSAGSIDLGNYPNQFKTDGKFEGQIVIGEDAKAIDTIGALFLADSLRNTEVKIVENVGKGVSEDIPLGSSLSASNEINQELTDSDIEGLLDTKINFQSQDYDVSELIVLGQSGNNLVVQTSLTSDDDYQRDIALEVDRDAIKYFYMFDESIDLEKITESKTLDIEVLGKKIKITDIDADNKFTAFVGEEYFLSVGDSVNVEGKTIELINVGASGTIVVDVDGTKETITNGNTENVAGIEISNQEPFYTDEKSERAVTLIIGKDAIETYADGEAFIGEDKDNPEWVWNIGNLKTEAASNSDSNSDGTGPFIGVENDFILNDDSDNPPIIGEDIKLPFDYVTIKLDELTVEDSDYRSYSFEYDDSADLSDALGDSASSARAVLISTTEDEGLIVRSSSLSNPEITKNEKVKKIWLFGEDSTNLAVLYLDKDNNKVKLAGRNDNDALVTFGEVNYGNTKANDVVLKANYSPLNGDLEITVSPSTADVSNDDLVMSFSLTGTNVRSLGTALSEDEASELTWNGVAIGTKDNDLRSKYGIIVKNPQNSGSDDEVELEIPEDEVQVMVSIFKESKTTRVIETGAVLPELVLDSEVGTGNLILVGGPGVNSKTAEVLGLSYPSYGTSAKFNVAEGQAMIKLVETNGVNYLIIAGFSGQDTRDAVELMTNFDRTSFEGQTERIINLVRI